MLLVSPQYNQEIHYVEPCLNGTLVRSDRTNKDVSVGVMNVCGSYQVEFFVINAQNLSFRLLSLSVSISANIWTSCLPKGSGCWVRRWLKHSQS